MTPENYECRTCHCGLHVSDGMDPLDPDVRFCHGCAIDEIERLHSLFGERFHLDAVCGSCAGPLDCERDAICCRCTDGDIADMEARQWQEARAEIERLQSILTADGVTQPCGHAAKWIAYRNPVDFHSETYCVFCEIEQQQAILRTCWHLSYGGRDFESWLKSRRKLSERVDV